MKAIKTYPSVAHFFMNGPAAVELHLEELEGAKNIHSESQSNKAIIRDCLRSIGLGKVTPKVRGLLRILATRTVIQIEKERDAFRTIQGEGLRFWEIEKSVVPG